MSQKSVACSCVVNFFALNDLASRRICLLVFGVGLVGVRISFSVSLVVDVVSGVFISAEFISVLKSGVFIFSGFGVSWGSRNLLLTRVGEELCICVFVILCCSGAGVFDFGNSGCWASLVGVCGELLFVCVSGIICVSDIIVGSPVRF